MKRIRIMGLCLVAVFAFSAVIVASASAEEPEFGRCIKKALAGGAGFSDAGCTKPVASAAKYEWASGVIKNKVGGKMTSELATLESEGGTKISCKKQKLTHPFEITGPKTEGNVEADYTECTSSLVACQSGVPKEEIITKVLEGEIGIEKEGSTEAADKIAGALWGPGGKTNGFKSALAEFECTGILNVIVKGSILVPVTTNKMLKNSTVKYTATKGEQKPSEFVGEVCNHEPSEKAKDGKTTNDTDCDNHNLVSKLKTELTGYEESGQSQTNVNEPEETMEASSVN